MANAPVKNIKSLNRWAPNPAPVNNDNLSDYLFNELNRLSDIIFNLDVMRLEQTNNLEMVISGMLMEQTGMLVKAKTYTTIMGLTG
jgi:hypothetical protein